MIDIKELIYQPDMVGNTHCSKKEPRIHFWQCIEDTWEVWDMDKLEALQTDLKWVDRDEVDNTCFPSLQSALDAYNKSLEK